MKKSNKRILALLMAFALILQYSFSASFMSVYAEGEDGQVEVTQTESSASESKAASEPAPAPAAEEPAAAPAAQNAKAAEPAPEAEPAGSDDSSGQEEAASSDSASDDAAPEEAASEDGESSDAVTEEDPAADPEAEAVEEEEEEEVKYPAKTFTGSAGGVSVSIDAPEGALPEGTEMKVSAVAAEEVQATVESAIGTDAAKIKAVDITFSVDGKKIEPKKAVSVKLNASGMDSNAEKKVVHIADNGSANVVTDNVTAGGSAAFSAKDFSIYLVVDEDEEHPEENAVATYEFYVGDDLVQTQYIKTEDSLADPGDLAGDGANTVFKGWYVKTGQTIEGETPGEKLSFGIKSSIPKTETIKVEAKVETTYYVTFRGEPDSNGDRGIVAVDTVTVEGPKGTEGTLDISGRSVIPKSDTSVFEGWMESEDGEIITETTITVTESTELFAKIVDANWIHFDENVDWDTSDSDPTYTGPVYVKKTDNLASKKPADPTRPGYTFGGWYTDEDCTELFAWSGTGLEKDITLYAKWTPGDSGYTVIIWKQKVTDAKDAADSAKTYDFESSEGIKETTGTVLSEDDFTSYTTHNYAGFHYGRIEISPEDKKVRADGTTVVNVYYDRNLLTIYFFDGDTQPGYAPTTGNDGQQYGLVDNEYVALTRHGNDGNYYWTYPGESAAYSGETYREVTGNSGTQYAFSGGEMVELTYTDGGCEGTYWALPDGSRYNGTRYSTGATGNSGYGIVDGELVNITHDDEGWSYTAQTTYTGTRYISSVIPDDDHIYTGLYGSTLESNGYTWKDDRAWYENSNGTGTRLTFLDAFKFEGLSGVSQNNTLLTQYGQRLSGNNPIRFYKQNIDRSWPTAATNTVYTTGGNTSFTVTEKYEGFKAVSYRNGNTGGWSNTSAGRSLNANNLNIRFERQSYTLTFIDPTDESVIDTKTGIPYEDAMSKYQITDPAKEHYDFKGWYEDTTGSAPFNWNSTMPAANKVLYAKWEPKQYHVSLDLNGGHIKEGSTQDAEFNVPLDTILDKDSLFQAVEYDNKHELVGWYYKDGAKAGSVYDFGKIEAPVNLIAKWRMPGQVTIVYDYGEGDDGSTKPVDNYKYATDSSVVLGEPPEKIKEKYAFVGWKLKDKDGKVLDEIYYPNNTFEITDDLIADYDEDEKTGKVKIVAVYNKTDEGSFTPTTITYDPNGGTGSSVTIDTGAHGDLLINEPIIALAVNDSKLGFTREGYEFVGWNTDPNGGGLAVAAGDDIAGDLRNLDKNTDINTLYAQWCKVYTVTFDPDGGTPDPADQKVKSGEKATEPADPTKENNDFLGWFEVVDGTMSDTEFDFNTPITKDTDLKAKWDPKTVTVTFNANGHGTAPEAQTINKGATATKPADPSEAGYEFGGWFTEAACTNEFDFSTPVNEDRTLYAKWTPIKYTVTFESSQSAADKNGRLRDPDGGLVDGYTEGDLGYGDATPAVTAVPNAGYEFAGWIKKSTGDTVQTPDATVTQDETYTATWTPKTDTKYTVNWYYQTPGSEEYVLKKSEERTGTTGTEVQLSDADLQPEAQYTSGYTYDVNTSKTLTKTTIAGDGKSEMHVYFWPVYNITFEAGDHGKLTDASGTETDKLGPHPQHYGDLTWAASDWEKHPDAGYKFSNWEPAVANKVTGHATYVAQWEALDCKYTVEFYYQEDGEYPGTAESSDERTGKTDASVEVTADDKKPTKDGYVLDESKSDAWTGTVAADDSLVLKVYFKQQFTVTFDANGHGTAPDAQKVDAGKTANKPADPTAEGYTFGGWFTDAECTNEYDFASPVNANMTLYAKWTESEPEPEPEPTPTPPTPTPEPEDEGTTPTPTPGGGGTPAVTPPAPVVPAAVIDDEPVPEVEPEEIPDDPAPAAAPEGVWALLNLLAAALSTVGAAVALLRKKEEEDEDEDEAAKKPEDEEEKDNRGRNMAIAKALGVAAAAASVITFVLTEDMSLPMAMTDKWTLLMAVLFAGQIGTAVANKKASELDEEEEAE